jgi:hypothetical protein
MIVNSIIFEKLSYLIQYYKDPIRGIPIDSGIYYWVYWPDFDPLTINSAGLNKVLLEYTERTLFFKETLKGRYKFEAEIREQGYPTNGNLFGLSPSNTLKLNNYLNLPAHRILFHEFFKEVCFSRPFYVGKAKNLRSRLATQHFKSTTEVVPEIDAALIPYSDIYVGYKIIPDPNDEDMNTIFEEILSRRVKPGLTKKPN